MTDNTVINDASGLNFIEHIIQEDINAMNGKLNIVTRFPPEPNGYLHIGHAKSIFLNYNLAKKYNGTFNLRFDDTNPVAEEAHFADAIEADVKWLGCNWDAKFYASDFFGKIHDLAIKLIESGDAYVCSLTQEEIRQTKGTLTEPGKNSPYRNRMVVENLDLFMRMTNGEFPEGAHVLRAKIDMSSSNLNLRDPVMYRILHKSHPHVGDKWCVYPMYDYTHGLCDYFEGVTHSLCTLEFMDHRPLYDWFLDKLSPHLSTHRPKQIEFSKLGISHTILSKRNLKRLVAENVVTGWSDPRMPTLSGLRARGFTPRSIANFCKQIGISKSDSIIDYTVLEDCLRNDLNEHAPRVMCVVDPLLVTIKNIETCEQILTANLHPNHPEFGSREIPFTKQIYIERSDFMEEPIPGYFRLAPGAEVRLRYGYIIKCVDVIKNNANEVVELICEADIATLGVSPIGRKVKGVIHWVSSSKHIDVNLNMLQRLVRDSKANLNEDWSNLHEVLNPNSLEIIDNAKIEYAMHELVTKFQHYQFERVGYFFFCLQQPATLTFNRAVTLRDSWNS